MLYMSNLKTFSYMFKVTNLFLTTRLLAAETCWHFGQTYNVNCSLSLLELTGGWSTYWTCWDITIEVKNCQLYVFFSQVLIYIVTVLEINLSLHKPIISVMFWVEQMWPIYIIVDAFP